LCNVSWRGVVTHDCGSFGLNYYLLPVLYFKYYFISLSSGVHVGTWALTRVQKSYRTELAMPRSTFDQEIQNPPQ
jgi:hypothetical protein